VSDKLQCGAGERSLRNTAVRCSWLTLEQEHTKRSFLPHDPLQVMCLWNAPVFITGKGLTALFFVLNVAARYLYEMHVKMKYDLFTRISF
jgi:hypothetical protein